ncbi:MAG TPA: transketolase [Dehalococcoidia bacterium]|nr:transketolase [Dehalococcoidia bacterium]
MTDPELDELCINTIRTLSIDAVQQANSGHPGMPMGAAALTYVLWDRFLRHNPADPAWPDRDRFVLSAGHASMLLYSMLYLTGHVGVTLDDLRRFRQWGSPAAGHPERGAIPGIEVTTGPLGQGFANSVGIAMAERFLGATFNRPGHVVIDHRTYVLASDGDMMEGISHEAASLAGHQKLGKLTCIYDANNVSLDGPTAVSFTEDVATRFEAYGWQVQRIDGMVTAQVAAALRLAHQDTERPSLIVAHTHIGYGSPHKQDSSKAHGSPLGTDEVVLTKRAYGWPEDETFYVPDPVLRHMREALTRGASWQQKWDDRMTAYASVHPDAAAELRQALAGELPSGWDASLPSYTPADKAIATRAASGEALNALSAAIPCLIGGSADLGESNNTEIRGVGAMTAETPGGRNIYFGVREHAMAAAANGMAAHGGVIPFVATFLVFSDYCRPSIRLASLSELGTIFVFTHDSVGLGEDGPTHQPIEHLMALRAMPGLTVIRPADPNETAAAWAFAIQHRQGPTLLALSRQAVPNLAGTAQGGSRGLFRGAYVVSEADGGHPDAILIATGSEVGLAVEAQRILAERGLRARVVSMPCWSLFEGQDQSYRDDVLPPAVRTRVSVEAGVTLGWQRWVGDDGASIGIDGRFGASAPAGVLMEQLGLTAERVAARTLALAERLSGARA